MENIIFGFIAGAVVFGLLIRAVIAAQKPPHIVNSPTATATANGGGGGAAQPIRGGIPWRLLVSCVILLAIAALAVSTIQTIMQRFEPDIKPIVVTVQPQAKPAIPVPAVPVVVAPEVDPIPVVTQEPIAPPVVAPLPQAVPANDPVPAWLIMAIVGLALVAIGMYGTLAIMIARDVQRKREADRLAAFEARSQAIDDELDQPKPREIRYNRPQKYIDEEAQWEAAIPDDIFNLGE